MHKKDVIQEIGLYTNIVCVYTVALKKRKLKFKRVSTITIAPNDLKILGANVCDIYMPKTPHTAGEMEHDPEKREDTGVHELRL